jgi:hypothetical protein
MNPARVTVWAMGISLGLVISGVVMFAFNENASALIIELILGWALAVLAFFYKQGE